MACNKENCECFLKHTKHLNKEGVYCISALKTNLAYSILVKTYFCYVFYTYQKDTDITVTVSTEASVPLSHRPAAKFHHFGWQAAGCSPASPGPAGWICTWHRALSKKQFTSHQTAEKQNKTPVCHPDSNWPGAVCLCIWDKGWRGDERTV